MPNGDLELYESYMKGVSKTGTSKKDQEKIDEGIDNFLVNFIQRINFNKNPTLDPGDKKEALRSAGAIQVYVDQIETELEKLEMSLGNAVFPGFEVRVRKLLKTII